MRSPVEPHHVSFVRERRQLRGWHTETQYTAYVGQSINNSYHKIKLIRFFIRKIVTKFFDIRPYAGA